MTVVAGSVWWCGSSSPSVCRVSCASRGRHDNGPPAVCRADWGGRAVLDARRHPVVTVEADLVRVESRLVSGRVVCPGCGGALGPWGWARPRGIVGLTGVLVPRRARCRGCLVTHVLLPVTVLLRRAYAVELIGAALVARAEGWGHRSIGRQLRVPAGTVRGWLRRVGTRLESARTLLLQVARRAGVDQPVPKAQGCPWRDLWAALEAARTAVTGRFGPFGVLGPVTVWQLAVACSAGRLLFPGWPPGTRVGRATPVASDAG
jgi:hypothetical protein